MSTTLQFEHTVMVLIPQGLGKHNHLQTSNHKKIKCLLYTNVKNTMGTLLKIKNIKCSFL